MSDLKNKYRPKVLAEMYGQKAVVGVLGDFFKRRTLPHSLLFSGPAGVGKTTLARIVATEYFEMDSSRVMEVDAATYSKVEDMRGLLKPLGYKNVDGLPKIVILDECHALSKQAWQVLLKTLEEPPEHVYFSLCTTELSKVPKTIQTRCAAFPLKEVSTGDMVDLLTEVAEEEEFQITSKALAVVAREAAGSPRQALVYLSMCHDCEEADEVRELIENMEAGKSIIDVCRVLVKASDRDPFETWDECVKVIKVSDVASYESARIIMCQYFSKVILGEKSAGRKTRWYLKVIDAFSINAPYAQSDGAAPFLNSLGILLMD